MALKEEDIKSRDYHGIGGYDILVLTLKDGKKVATINDVPIDSNAVKTMREKFNKLVEDSVKSSPDPISHSDIVKYVTNEMEKLDLTRDEEIIAHAYKNSLRTMVSGTLFKLEHQNKVKSDMVIEEINDHARSVRKYEMA